MPCTPRRERMGVETAGIVSTGLGAGTGLEIGEGCRAFENNDRGIQKQFHRHFTVLVEERAHSRPRLGSGGFAGGRENGGGIDGMGAQGRKCLATRLHNAVFRLLHIVPDVFARQVEGIFLFLSTWTLASCTFSGFSCAEGLRLISFVSCTTTSYQASADGSAQRKVL